MPPKLRQSHIEDFCYSFNSQHRIAPACARPHSCCFAQHEVVEISSDSDICSVHSPARTAQPLDMSSSIEGLQGCAAIPAWTQFSGNAWILTTARQRNLSAILLDQTCAGTAKASQCGRAHSNAFLIQIQKMLRVSKAQHSRRTNHCRIQRPAWFTMHCPAKQGSLGLILH